MYGCQGNDTYIVDLVKSGIVASFEDKIVEYENEGTDLIRLRGEVALDAATTLTLGSAIENLDASLTGMSLLNLRGNASNNILTGNNADNALDGALGNDLMIGGRGNDVYTFYDAMDIAREYVDQGNDTVLIRYANASLQSVILDMNGANFAHIENMSVGNASGLFDIIGSDVDNILTGNSAANNLFGGLGNDTLDGGSGNDMLDGGAGINLLLGGTGHDIYIVNSADDIVQELVAGSVGGSDTVRSAISYVLGVNVEHLTLIGHDDLSGTGNALANTITGNDGANHLYGGAGIDKLYGGNGNDVYDVDIVTSAGVAKIEDGIYENANEGIDTIHLHGATSAASATFNLSANQENLDASDTGHAALILKGNELDNRITGNDGNNQLVGNDGNDILDGGLGSDMLTGGAGADTYVLHDTGSVDHIYGFNAAEGDKLDLAGLFEDFDPLNDLLNNYFSTSTSGRDTQLSLDRDGAGTAFESTQVAVIHNVSSVNLDDLLHNGQIIV
ncbi:MAG: Serralysin [Alphaproteobacteria bacterium]|nr:Serralysin [Alphaproteobacteria bacterium]